MIQSNLPDDCPLTFIAEMKNPRTGQWEEIENDGHFAADLDKNFLSIDISGEQSWYLNELVPMFSASVGENPEELELEFRFKA